MINKERKEDWERIQSEIKIGDILFGEVIKVEPYGVYVDLNKSFNGLILAPYIGEKNIEFNDYPKVGEKLKVIVIHFSEFKGEFTYINLSSRQCDFTVLAPCSRSNK